MTNTLISSLPGFIIGLIGIGSSIWINLKLIRQKNREDEKKEIYKKLNEFYGPLIQYRKKSQKLYDILKSNQAYPIPTLKALLDGHEFTGNDKVLLEEIVKIGKECEDLILNKAGLIDDELLRVDLLPKASAHYYILRMAFQGIIKGDIERLEDYVFPQEFDFYVESKIGELQKRLTFLNR